MRIPPLLHYDTNAGPGSHIPAFDSSPWDTEIAQNTNVFLSFMLSGSSACRPAPMSQAIA